MTVGGSCTGYETPYPLHLDPGFTVFNLGRFVSDGATRSKFCGWAVARLVLLRRVEGCLRAATTLVGCSLALASFSHQYSLFHSLTRAA